MGWSCRRPGCSREAQVAITYDAVACQVWLDPLEVAPGGAQPLCGEHAGRLSPPRGWVVLDRRNSQASLMTISPPVVEQAGRRAVARRRFPRRWGQFDEPRLEFVGPDTAVLDEPEAVPASESLLKPEPVSEPEPVLEFDQVHDQPALDPDLAPVIDNGPDREIQPAIDNGPDPSPDPSPEHEPARDPARPAAGQRAPEASLLKPKGRLLSRAFDLTGDQHSVLTGASGVVAPPDDPSPPDVAAADGDA